jgi:hypothetical protein
MAESYVIEGVDFLPAHAARLSTHYAVRAVFLGRSHVTLADFDQFPGHSPGYSRLPEAVRRQIVGDVPRWSKFVQQECERFGYPYIDVAGDFPRSMDQAEAVLTAGE